MLSIRTITRSTPRALSRLTASTVRRSIPNVPFLQAALKPAKSQFAAAFSTSMARKERAGEVDEELVAKFESELEMEAGVSENLDVSPSIKEYLENGPFEIEDVPGREEVVLTRKFGDENIRVTFSTADLNSIDPESDYEDRALDDEESEESEDTNNGGRNRNFKAAPEDSIENADEDAKDQGSFPARVYTVIEKPGKGALVVEAVVQDGMIDIDEVYYYPDASYALDKTAQISHERRDLYTGPHFSNLDEDLQLLFDKYLDERCINTALALFVTDYIDMKEQKEYTRWLSKMRDFIDA